MLNIKKEILNSPVTEYKGSEKTKAMVEEQIKNRWGEAEVKNLNCYQNLRTYRSWENLGYRPKKGSRSIRSVTVVEKKDPAGNIISKYPREVCLFYYRQVEKIGAN